MSALVAVAGSGGALVISWIVWRAMGSAEQFAEATGGSGWHVVSAFERIGIGDAAAVGRDTFAERSYFSYRRAAHAGEPDFGRLISVIALTE